MSLFVGRLAPEVRTRDLQESFGKFGTLKRCDIKGTFAFVTFEDERDAEDALEELQGKDLYGSRINIEWAKGSGRYDPVRTTSRDDKCFECGERGHFARDCRRRPNGSPGGPPGARRGRGRGRGGGARYSRDGSRSPRRRSWSRGRSRSRSPKKRSGSRSPSRSRSRSPRNNPHSASRSRSRTPVTNKARRSRSRSRERERERVKASSRSPSHSPRRSRSKSPGSPKKRERSLS